MNQLFAIINKNFLLFSQQILCPDEEEGRAPPLHGPWLRPFMSLGPAPSPASLADRAALGEQLPGLQDGAADTHLKEEGWGRLWVGAVRGTTVAPEKLWQ